MCAHTSVHVCIKGTCEGGYQWTRERQTPQSGYTYIMSDRVELQVPLCMVVILFFPEKQEDEQSRLESEYWY